MLSCSISHVRRSLHSTVSNMARKAGRRANPGAAYQLESLEGDAEKNLASDPEGFGDMESDFMEVHRTHREHEQELLKQSERVRHLMIKHKYFREQRLPNLLTFAEKEQIRLLHARDAAWTVERLAESFPATPQIVQKILEAKWRPRSVKRIREHDKAVISNWEKLRAGDTLQLPPELRDHLEKFAARSMTDLRQTRVEDLSVRTPVPQPQRKEFLSIITSCNKYAETNKQKAVEKLKAGKKATQLPPSADPEDETYLLEKVVDKRKMRLEELKRLKLTSADLAVSRNATSEPLPEVEALEKQAVDTLRNPGGTGIVARTPHKNPFTNVQVPAEINYAQKFESNEIIISTDDQRLFEMTAIKDRIHIPRKLQRKGATYRVEDCYYDDDGEFLYRVPGMTN